MPMLRSHLTILECSAARYPRSPAFKIPQQDSHGNIESWESITYQQFRADVEMHARYWMGVFTRDGIPRRSVISIWVTGSTYADLLHIYGISRAGYTLQLFSQQFLKSETVYELSQRANTQALLYAQIFESGLQDLEVQMPIYPAKFDASTGALDANELLLPELSATKDYDIAFILHTSGSISGSPKLVPCSYRWVDGVVDKLYQFSAPKLQNSQRQVVSAMIGSMCHSAQSTLLIGDMQHGSCVIQPTTLSYGVDELMKMVHQCGLNRLCQFGSHLGKTFRAARSDPELLSLLATLDEICYLGTALTREDEAWAYANRLRLRGMYGTSETATVMSSVIELGNSSLLRTYKGYSYRFIPAISDLGDESTTHLLELIIPAESTDCPDISLRHADGDFHTGDLFQEAFPGLYIFRGRNDDWIKTENAGRCDTKAIEDNVLSTCGDLIANCVVVGSGRPSPVLFLEPQVDMDHGKLKEEIIEKTRQFHSRHYAYECITSPDMIVIVPRQSLPRTSTKGNIRRKAVEEAYKSVLDKIHLKH